MFDGTAPQYAGLSLKGRYVLIGITVCCCDSMGYFLADAKWLEARIFPLKHSYRTLDLRKKALQELEKRDIILRHETSAGTIFNVVDFIEDQPAKYVKYSVWNAVCDRNGKVAKPPQNVDQSDPQSGITPGSLTLPGFNKYKQLGVKVEKPGVTKIKNKDLINRSYINQLAKRPR